jgi:hypothetical protein
LFGKGQAKGAGVSDVILIIFLTYSFTKAGETYLNPLCWGDLSSSTAWMVSPSNHLENTPAGRQVLKGILQDIFNQQIFLLTNVSEQFRNKEMIPEGLKECSEKDAELGKLHLFLAGYIRRSLRLEINPGTRIGILDFRAHCRELALHQLICSSGGSRYRGCVRTYIEESWPHSNLGALHFLLL